MTIVFSGAGTYTERTAETSSPVPFPASVPAGSIAVLCGSVKGAARVVDQTGWTTDTSISCIGNTNPPALFVAHKLMAGTEGGTNLSVTHGNNVSAWQILVFNLVDQTTPIDVAVQTVDQSTGTNNTPVPSSTVVTAGAAGVYAAAFNSTVATSTPPSGWTEDGDRVSGTAAFTVAHILGLPTGATGTIQNTWSATARSIGAVVILRPAAVGDATVNAVVATVSVNAPAPAVQVIAVTINAVVATVSVNAPAPVVSVGASLRAVVATVTASASAPVVNGGATVNAVVATVSVSAPAPVVSTNIVINAVSAGVSVAAIPPTIQVPPPPVRHATATLTGGDGRACLTGSSGHAELTGGTGRAGISYE